MTIKTISDSHLYFFRRARLVLTLGIGLLAATTVNGQTDDDVIIDVTDCVEIEDRLQRFDCFESRVNETQQASEGQRENGRAIPTASTETGRGRSSNDEALSEDPEDIVATVTSIREVGPNLVMVYLDNDQIWRQNMPRRYLLREGAEVRLRPTRWGSSYRLTDPEVGYYIQVERVR